MCCPSYEPYAPPPPATAKPLVPPQSTCQSSTQETGTKPGQSSPELPLLQSGRATLNPGPAITR